MILRYFRAPTPGKVGPMPAPDHTRTDELRGPANDQVYAELRARNEARIQQAIQALGPAYSCAFPIN